MSGNDSSLQLAYVFTPTPNPILASVSGDNPNTIDLNVMVSNPTSDTVSLNKIEIDIPVGSDDAYTLTTAISLPNPDNVAPGSWSVSTSNGSITLTPPVAGVEGQALTFTLPGIAVNTQPGYVQFTVTEFSEAGKNIDDTTYGMVKFAADFPITNFYAEPAVVTNLDETVTLYWECSAQGANYVYNVHSDSWLPQDCLNEGQCYSCTDGVVGVVTPALSLQTTFSLDVITVENGNREIYQTLTTTVPVQVPSVSQNSYLTYYPTGWCVNLHWLAYNAASCTVSLDGTPVATNLPTDTYEQGYLVSLMGVTPGPHQLTVTAYAFFGPAQATFIFSDVDPSDTFTSISVGQSPQGIAITPDGTLALVTNTNSNSMSVIDIASRSVEAHTIPVGDEPASITITPNGTIAFVANWADSTLSVIDIASRSVEPATIALPPQPASIAITPDGTLTLVASTDNNNVSVIDIASRSVEANTIPVGENPQGIAITPDGTLALVTNTNSNSVSVIDIASRSVEVNTIPVGQNPWGIAITPDGTLALIINAGNVFGVSVAGSVSVIDIVSRSTEANTIPVGTFPQGIAITPDGILALVTNSTGNSVSIIDIANRTAEAGSIPVGNNPLGIAITPNGTIAFVANSVGASVSVL